MAPQSWIIRCLRMYKISHEVEQTMKTWRVELTAGGRCIAETKIQRGIFLGDLLSPLVFIIAMMSLNHILRKCAAGYKLSRSQENFNHPMYMGDIKLFAKNEKGLETVIHAFRIYSLDIGREFGIEKCAMLVMKSGKWNGTTKSRQNYNARRKLNLQILGYFGGWHHQTNATERHDPKRISQENKKTTRVKTLQQKPHKRNKYLGYAPSQIFGTLSQVDQRRT